MMTMIVTITIRIRIRMVISYEHTMIMVFKLYGNIMRMVS